MEEKNTLFDTMIQMGFYAALVFVFFSLGVLVDMKKLWPSNYYGERSQTGDFQRRGK